MSIGWNHPAALVLLMLVPLYLCLARSRNHTLPLPRAGALRSETSAGQLIGHIPELLRSLLLLCLILAIAGPRVARAGEPAGEGIPIVLAIDISSSMLAQDFRPLDRLSVAKATIARFVEGRPADPIGIVGFAAEALTLVPPTLHRPVVMSALEILNPGLLEDGTAIGDGLATAVNRLRHLEGGGVIVLLSDGESNRGQIDPLAAADAAAELGIRVHTIGIGSDQVAPVPIGSGALGVRYAELAVGLDEELLREIARRTGGVYQRATDAPALQRIYAELDRLIPVPLEDHDPPRGADLTALLLLAGAILLPLEWGVRASRWGAVP